MHSIKRAISEEELKQILHEIRNPLTAIHGANEALSDAVAAFDDDGSLDQLTGIVARNTQKILDILKGVFAHHYLRESMTQEICLSHMIDTALNQLADRIHLKNIKVSKHYDAGVTIHGNPGTLGIALLNLLVNSIEAIKDTGGLISVGTYGTDSEVIVELKDNGMGMESDIAAQMFEQHFSGKSEGLGFGLSRVRTILREHHALVTVYSAPGSGTAIVMVFPKIKNI